MASEEFNMDSAEMVSAIPDFSRDGPNTGDGLLTAAVDAPESSHPAEPMACLSNPEAAAVRAEQELCMRESSITDHEEETNKIDVNGNVEDVVESSISAGRSSPGAVVVQQIMDTVVIEVDFISPTTDAESRPDAGTVVLASNTRQEVGHVGFVTDLEDVKIIAQEVAVEVILDNDVIPNIGEARVSSFGEIGSSDLGEVRSVTALSVEPQEVRTVEGSANVPTFRGIEQSSQVGNAGDSFVIEAAVFSDPSNTVISAKSPHVDEQAVAGVGAEEGRMERDISSIVKREQENVEVVICDPAPGRRVSVMENEFAGDLLLEDKTSIEEPRSMNKLEGETENVSVDNVVQLDIGHVATTATQTTEEVEEVRPLAICEEALNPIDQSTIFINFNAPQLDSSEVLTTLDQGVEIPVVTKELSVTKSMPGTEDIAMEQLDGIAEGTSITTTDELVKENLGTGVVGDKGEELPLGSERERSVGAELDSKSFVMPGTEGTIMEQLDRVAEDTAITTTDELVEENLGTGVVGDRGEELPLSGENAGFTSVGEIGHIFMTIDPGERDELSNSEQMEINEMSCVQLVETNEILGPTMETNLDVPLATDEAETTLESTIEILIRSPEIRNEDPAGSTSKIGTAPEETLTQAAGEKLLDTGVKRSDVRTQEPLAVTVQEVMPKLTNEAGGPLDETMTDIINSVDVTVVEERELNETVNPPAIKHDGEGAVVIAESLGPGDGTEDVMDDDLIDPERCLVAVEEAIDTTISIPTIQQETGEAPTEDRHGVLIGVGSSVESRGLTITEIADTAVAVKEFQVEQQSVWGLSDPLITPPEEEIIEAIGDLCGAVDDVVGTDERPNCVESLVLVVTEDNGQYESNDFKTSSDGEAHIPSGGKIGIHNSRHAAQSDEGVVLDNLDRQTLSMSVVVDMDEPLDLPDERSLLPTPKETEMGTGDNAAATPACPPLTTPAENTLPIDIAAEDNTPDDSSEKVPRDGSPAIAEGVHLPRNGQAFTVPNEVERPVVSSEVGTRLTAAFESNLVSISMSSCGEGKLSSTDESATAVVEQVSAVYQDHTTEGDASDLVAPITYELGFDPEKAGVDKSVLISGVRPMESIEASVFTAVAEEGMDVRSNELSGFVSLEENDRDGGSTVPIEECAQDGSAYMVVDKLETAEALERNEKKRGREEESDAEAKDTEKINNKAARTSNFEISVLANVEGSDVKIGEDVQVDKKRSREELLKTVSENPDITIQNKVQKTGSVQNNSVSHFRNADTEEVEVEDCVDMEDKEESHETSLNGAVQDSAAPRYKKRKIAIFLGYSGAGYQGMQKNPGAVTIEGELEEALFRAGAIAESNYGQPQKLDWRRAARTDKGVSAVGQVVSGNFFVDPPGFVERVNSHLPKQIRVYGYKRATASFNAKKLCDRRKYEYVLPVYGFDPTVHLDRETAQALAVAEKANSLNEAEMKASETKVSGPAVEREASVVIEREMKETVMEESTGTSVELVGETISSVSSDATNSVVPKTESNEGNQSSGDGMFAITEEVTTVTEVSHKNIAAAEIETGFNNSPELKQDVDEQAKIAKVEVPVQTKEFSDATVPGTVIDLTDEGKREALDEKVKKSTYKFDEAEFNRLNRILNSFEGHHNFHNFTARTKATDPSANRYIISFGVENTLTINGIEFVRCSVVGQSFMIHQIRKMIGLAVAIMRGSAPESILATALRRDTKINVPMAPELGLFLEECYYSSYNRRFKATHEEMSLSTFSAEVSEFKKEFIYPHIGSTEARDSTFAMWLHSLNDRHYPDFVAAREAEKLIKSQ